MALPSKSRKCRNPACLKMFKPYKALQSACCFECEVAAGIIAAEKSKAKREKAERIAVAASTKILRLKLKTRSQWMKEAQIAFNAYIRERDKCQPCICCGKPLGSQQIGGGFDAGHYRSIGSAPHLRFDERNVHGQQKQCNRYGAGRAVDYRIGLIARIGIDAVDSLEADNEPRKYSIEDLKQIIATYRQKIRELNNGN